MCALTCNTQGLTQLGEFGILHWPRREGEICRIHVSVSLEKRLTELGLLWHSGHWLGSGTLFLLSKLEMVGLLDWF